MSGNEFMNVTKIAEELGVSKITVEFWLKRFNKWLPHIVEKDEKRYSMKTFDTLLFIAERINAGMLPSEIEKSLKEKFSDNFLNNFNAIDSETDFVENLGDKLSDKDTVSLLRSFLTRFDSNQERIAKAHERRAKAEERKAIAIEKRAEAEEKKAIAMNNIANALQNMKHEVWPGNNENQIKSEAAGAILLDESLMEESFVDDLHEEKHSDIDDLSLLVDIDADEKEIGHKSPAISTDVPFQENHDGLDDLSLLIDPDDVNSSETSDKDTKDIHDDLDDLSILLDEKEKTKSGKTEKDETGNETGKNIDDLSLLIDDTPDDLSLLIDEKEKKDQNNMDNLALLIEDETEEIQDDLKPSVTLEENFDQYKSEIINSIIKLKKEGLSVEDTTQRLNKAGVKTLSGKSRWGIKTIAKIYKFIESVT